MIECPSDETFAGFVDGDSAPAARESVEQHIDGCPRCRVALAEMTRADVPNVHSKEAAPVPQHIGRFELRERLGEGAMGVVYLARDPTLKRDVAIKIVRPALARTSADAARLISEAQLAARLNHPNAVTVYEVGPHEDQVFIAMEYVPGATLRRCIDDGLHWRKAIELLVGAGRGLQAAHDAGLIHRDFKPENVIVGGEGRARVTDFGLARVDEPRHSGGGKRAFAITDNTTGAGTPIYMAPEQLLGGSSSAHSDQYAFAVTCYQALYGKLPYHADSIVELAHQVITEPVPAPPADSTVPPGVFAVITRAMSVESDERFSSLADLLERLVLAAGGRQTQADEERDVPYPGLTAFAPSDASRYHGRTAEVERGRRLLEAHNLVAIVGPSGVGKSSFVSAGLYPALDRQLSWHLVSLRPGDRPMLRLATQIKSATGSNESAAGLAHLLARWPERLAAMLSDLAAAKRVRVLLFVDQFEELYTLAANPAERDAFARCIAAISRAEAGRGEVQAVLALRSDFVDQVADQRILLAALAGAFLFLPAPDRAALGDALRKPLEPFGYRFESESLVDELLAGLSDSAAALPLLQFVASRMWAARDRENRLLTRESFDRLGAVDGALAAHADSVVVGFSPAERDRIRRLFLRLVTPAQTRDVVALSELCELAPEAKTAMADIVDRLAAERLLVVRDNERGQSMVELVHDSLIRSWPSLAGWLAASRAHAVRLAELRAAALQWHNNERSPGLLWRGEMAIEARTIALQLGDQLGDRERDFARAIERAHSQAARRRRSLVLGAMATLAAIATLAIVAAIWIGRAERRAVDQADIAREEAGRARAAEKERSTQLDTLRREVEQRQAAEKAAASAVNQSELSQSELARRNLELGRALEDIETAKSLLAKRSAALEKANGELEITNAELQRKLEIERRRLKEQKKRGDEIVDGELR